MTAAQRTALLAGRASGWRAVSFYSERPFRQRYKLAAELLKYERLVLTKKYMQFFTTRTSRVNGKIQ
jgi:hypothetical protein